MGNLYKFLDMSNLKVGNSYFPTRYAPVGRLVPSEEYTEVTNLLWKLTPEELSKIGELVKALEKRGKK